MISNHLRGCAEAVLLRTTQDDDVAGLPLMLVSELMLLEARTLGTNLHSTEIVLALGESSPETIEKSLVWG